MLAVSPFLVLFAAFFGDAPVGISGERSLAFPCVIVLLAICEQHPNQRVGCPSCCRADRPTVAERDPSDAFHHAAYRPTQNRAKS